MLNRGIIRESKSPWASPIVLANKKDGTKQFCVDYRRINQRTKKDLYLDYTWRVNEDLCSSDHYPIYIESNNSVVEERVQHWRLHRADSEAFQQSCGESLTISQFEREERVEDPIAFFTGKLNNIAEKNIPKISTVPRKIDKPWFDEKCINAIDQRKKSLKKFKIHPTRQNLDGYKKD